jgi:hypothetical protein
VRVAAALAVPVFGTSVITLVVEVACGGAFWCAAAVVWCVATKCPMLKRIVGAPLCERVLHY